MCVVGDEYGHLVVADFGNHLIRVVSIEGSQPLTLHPRNIVTPSQPATGTGASVQLQPQPQQKDPVPTSPASIVTPTGAGTGTSASAAPPINTKAGTAPAIASPTAIRPTVVCVLIISQTLFLSLRALFVCVATYVEIASGTSGIDCSSACQCTSERTCFWRKRSSV
jgi:hypothetical protein